MKIRKSKIEMPSATVLFREITAARSRLARERGVSLERFAAQWLARERHENGPLKEAA